MMKLSFRYRTIAVLTAACALAGGGIGAVAWLMKWLIKEISTLVTSPFHADGGLNWWLVPLATGGIVLTGYIVRHFVRRPLEHATEQLKVDLAAGRGRLPLRLTVASVITSAITLGCGGSAGAEGPIAFSGGAVGSNVARLIGLNDRNILIFMACGAGAGIAALFKSPVGGMFYTMEVLRMQLGVVPVLMLAAMCLLSSLTTYAMSGFTPDLYVDASLAFDWSMLPALILLGLLCGAYSAYYLSSGLFMRHRLEAIKRPVVRNIVSGLILGVLLMLFPALFGEGYDVLSRLANGHLEAVTDGTLFTSADHSWRLLASIGGLLLAKGVAAYTTNSGGGVAGDFAPTIFAGGMAGAFLMAALPSLAISPEIAVVCGMAGVMAGATRAPLMAIFIVTEMTGTMPCLLPVTITVLIAFPLSKIIKNRLN